MLEGYWDTDVLLKISRVDEVVGECVGEVIVV